MSKLEYFGRIAVKFDLCLAVLVLLFVFHWVALRFATKRMIDLNRYAFQMVSFIATIAAFLLISLVLEW